MKRIFITFRFIIAIVVGVLFGCRPARCVVSRELLCRYMSPREKGCRLPIKMRIENCCKDMLHGMPMKDGEWVLTTDVVGVNEDEAHLTIYVTANDESFAREKSCEYVKAIKKYFDAARLALGEKVRASLMLERRAVERRGGDLVEFDKRASEAMDMLSSDFIEVKSCE